MEVLTLLVTNTCWQTWDELSQRDSNGGRLFQRDSDGLVGSGEVHVFHTHWYSILRKEVPDCRLLEKYADVLNPKSKYLGILGPSMPAGILLTMPLSSKMGPDSCIMPLMNYGKGQEPGHIVK